MGARQGSSQQGRPPTDGGLVPSQTSKDLAACADNTAGKIGDWFVLADDNYGNYSILVYILLFTQTPIPGGLDGTIIDSRIILVDLSPTFYCLPKPLLVHGSMLLLSTLILSSYSIIVVMLGCDWGLRMVIGITCFKTPGSGFIFAASEYSSMTNKEIIQYTSVLFIYPSPYSCMS